MNANTNIKQGYKQTSLGILPQEWEVVRLGDICEIYQPQTIPQSDFTKEGYNVYGANGIIGKYHSYNHEKEQIAIACRGNSCGAVNFTNPKSWITGNAMVINLDNSKNADKIFVYYVLLNSNLNYLVTGSGQPQITSNIKNHSIKLPALAEQEKIAQILGVWDKGISVLKSLIEAKTKRKKALMQRLLTPPCESLTPSLRASETSAAIHNKSVDCHDLTASNLAKTEKDSKAKQSLRFAEFTDKWQEMRLGDICEIYQPQTIPQSDFTKEGYNVYGANGIIGKYHSYNHEKEQIAIACRGNSCGAVNFTNPKSWITGNAMVINLDNSKNADKIFVYYVLLNSNLNYLVTGSGQPQITSNIKKHSIKLPTLAEQKKIAQVLSACDKEIELLKSKFQCLKTQKKGLMQRLLNGEVRVKC